MIASPALAQDGPLDALTDHVTIRQSLKDKNTVNEPAFGTLTFPDSGSSSNQVAVAAIAALLPATKNLDDPTQDFSGPNVTRIGLKLQLAKPQKRALLRRPAAMNGRTVPRSII